MPESRDPYYARHVSVATAANMVFLETKSEQQMFAIRPEHGLRLC